MLKQIERQIRELQKELADVQKEWNAARLQPCRGDAEIRKKDEALRGLEIRMDSLQGKILELERKRREMMSAAVIKNAGYESPFT